MTRVQQTVTAAAWTALLEETKLRSGAQWRFVGDDGAFLAEGRLTHIPATTITEWRADQTLFIGTSEVGEPVLIGVVRSWERLDS